MIVAKRPVNRRARRRGQPDAPQGANGKGNGMSVRETIDEALKNAQKAREAKRVSALRLVRAAIQADDIARRGEGRAEAGDPEILQILARMVKQREESAAAFDAGKRPELAAKE